MHFYAAVALLLVSPVSKSPATIKPLESSSCPSGDCTRIWFDPVSFERDVKPRASWETLDEGFRGFLSDNSARLRAPGPRVQIELQRVSEDEVNGVPRTSLSYAQYVDAYRVLDGELIATFANNTLVAFHGRVLDDAPALASIARSATAEAPCTVVNREEPVYSRTYASPVLLRYCGSLKQLVTLDGKQVLESENTSMDWTQTFGPVNSLQTSNPGGSWFGHVKTIGSVVSCPHDNAPPGCNTRRLSIGSVPIQTSGSTIQLNHETQSATDAAPPFPATYSQNNSVFAATSFTGADSYTTTLKALGQVAHERIGGVASRVANDWAIGLWAYRYPSNNDSLRVYVWNDVDSRCGSGAPGSFTPSTEDICLNFGFSPGFDWSRTPMHEYGHYLHHSYGLGSSSCDEKAVTEGLADALSISLEWARQNPTPGHSRFITGLGFARSYSLGASQGVTTNGNFATMGMNCSHHNDNKYAKGMAISQVLWKLLNNRFCDYRSGSCTYRNVIPDMTYAQTAQVARQTLTITMDDTGGEAPIREFMTEWWYNLYYSVSWPSVWPLRQIFLQHEVTLPRQNPHGNLDGVTPSHYGPGMTYTFSGWACDRDTPANGERQDVHVYVGGVGLASVVSNQPSEGAVAQACSDPTYSNHRFSYTISNAALRNVVGTGSKTVHVYAIDSDFTDGNHNVVLPGPQQVYVYPYGW